MANRSKTPSFIAERRIYTPDPNHDKFIDSKMDLGNRIYNNGVRHFKEVLSDLYADKWYQHALTQFRKAEKGSDVSKEWSSEIYACMASYGLTEFSIHEYLGAGKVQSCPDGIGINIVQKLGTALYKSITKAVYSQTKVHFRKYGQTDSLEDKRANSGIIYNDKNGTVKIMGQVYNLKPVRASDHWMQEALTHRVKYCRIVRRSTFNGYKYYLQIVLEGTPPKKIKPGQGGCGLDIGTSTVAIVNDNGTDFHVLADGVEKYEAEIRKASRTHETRQRLANPQCYNEDGTFKKGAKITVRTKGMLEALQKLKGAYQKKSSFIKNSHGYLTNRILEECDHFAKEPMSFQALAKKAKGPAEKSDKTTMVKSKLIRKNKRKRRFGTSINRRAPGSFVSILERKAAYYGIEMFDVDSKKYKASQYDHTTGKYRKPGLSERTKLIGGHMVQRDLYSAFLLYCMYSISEIDALKCKQYFKRFLNAQGKTVDKIRKQGDATRNFGLRDFIAA